MEQLSGNISKCSFIEYCRPSKAPCFEYCGEFTEKNSCGMPFFFYIPKIHPKMITDNAQITVVADRHSQQYKTVEEKLREILTPLSEESKYARYNWNAYYVEAQADISENVELALAEYLTLCRYLDEYLSKIEDS